MMRHLLYEIVSILLIVAGVGFFYACVRFLAQRDYVGGLLLVVVGFGVMKSGVELSKLAVMLRREAGE